MFIWKYNIYYSLSNYFCLVQLIIELDRRCFICSFFWSLVNQKLPKKFSTWFPKINDDIVKALDILIIIDCHKRKKLKAMMLVKTGQVDEKRENKRRGFSLTIFSTFIWKTIHWVFCLIIFFLCYFLQENNLCLLFV